LTPCIQQFPVSQTIEPFFFSLSPAYGQELIHYFLKERSEGIRVCERKIGSPIPQVQVANDVMDGPPLELRLSFIFFVP